MMQQLTAPPGAETEAMVEGDRTIGGLRGPSTRYGEGIGSYNLLWNVIFPKSMAGKKVQIRGIIDSNNEVRESDETLNHSPWLEVQLPLEIRRPPAELKPTGGKSHQMRLKDSWVGGKWSESSQKLSSFSLGSF
jgi:hypothetical protein